MIPLIIIGVILVLVFLILFLPINVNIKFDDDFFLKIKFAGIKLFEIPEKVNLKKPVKSKKTAKKPKETSKEENFAVKEAKQLFQFLQEKYGFMGAVKVILSFLKDVLIHIKNLLKHFKLKKILFDLTVSGEDAADTAIKYGKACAAAYPVLAFLDSFSNINFKNINITSDFTDNKNEFKFYLELKMQIIYMLIAAVKIFSEYKNFTLKENYNERKQH